MKSHWSTLVAAALILTAVGALIFGCSKDDSPVANKVSESTVISTVVPADGAVNVPTSTNISVKFSEPVDTTAVMANFYFCGGTPMEMWRDSLNHYGGFGHMNMTETDHMMDWIDSIEWSGQFHWDSARDSCLFNPDSSLAPGTQYMLLFYDGDMMPHGGGMMGGSGHVDNGYHFFQFTTAP